MLQVSSCLIITYYLIYYKLFGLMLQMSSCLLPKIFTKTFYLLGALISIGCISYFHFKYIYNQFGDSYS